jgi:acetylornithine deacetylase
MIKAVEALLEAGERDFGLLFVVGEERNSAGAYRAAATPRGSRYIVNGEPTENKLALGCKGALRYEVVASGKMAHSAYPELGDSAIHKLVEALGGIGRFALSGVRWSWSPAPTMSTEMQQILSAVRALSSKEREELARALDALVSPAHPNKDLVLAIRGRYAHVPTSSDAFMARKHEELALDN